MNSGGPGRLLANLGAVLTALLVLLRLARPALSAIEDASIVAVGRTGTLGLALYLVLLYGVTYRLVRPDGLPSMPVQLLTFVFYGLAIGGIWAHRQREPAAGAPVSPSELTRIIRLFGLVIVLGLGLAVIGRTPVVLVPAGLILATWTPLGLLLTLATLASGVRERLNVGR